MIITSTLGAGKVVMTRANEGFATNLLDDSVYFFEICYIQYAHHCFQMIQQSLFQDFHFHSLSTN